jgi:hypothetical protein
VIDRKVGISVVSDTHWPHHGGGRKKEISPSGLTYMLGFLLTRMIIASHVCSQDYCVCKYFENKKKAGKTVGPDETVRAHQCPRNFAKSKSPKQWQQLPLFSW